MCVSPFLRCLLSVSPPVPTTLGIGFLFSKSLFLYFGVSWCESLFFLFGSLSPPLCLSPPLSLGHLSTLGLCLSLELCPSPSLWDSAPPPPPGLCLSLSKSLSSPFSLPPLPGPLFLSQGLCPPLSLGLGSSLSLVLLVLVCLGFCLSLGLCLPLLVLSSSVSWVPTPV